MVHEATKPTDNWYESIFICNPVPMLICALETSRILDANAAMKAEYGYRDEQLHTVCLHDIIQKPQDDSDSSSNASVIHRVRCRDGIVGHAAVLRSSLRWQGVAAELVVLQDLTAHMLAESRLRQVQQDLHHAQRLALIGTWYWDPATDSHNSSSPQAFEIFGLDTGVAPVSTHEIYSCIHPEDREAVARARTAALSDPAYQYDVHFRVQQRRGNVRFVHSTAEVQFDECGQPRKMIGVVRDETEQVCALKAIERLAFYDNVTSLANRYQFDKLFQQRLTSHTGTSDLTALLIINLLHFREINFALGHANGDVFLRLAAERIQSVVRDIDVVARVGSRFPVMLLNADQQEAKQCALAIQRALEIPFSAAGISYEIGAHIGIAVAPDHGLDYGTLLRKADIALFQGTHNGQYVSIYDPAFDPHTPERLSLIGEFRKAIENGHIRVYCQPKVNMRHGVVVGAEALVRWNHPTLGIISPEVFIPLIESTDLIHLLTRHMLASAVEQGQRWQRGGIDLPLAVNLSTRDVSSLNLSRQLQDLLTLYGAASSSLELEITESTIMRNPNVSLAELGRLSDMGFRLSVDDFGTGYSSLSYLTRLPVNVLKIDHGFTMQMINDRRSATIVKSTIQLAHELGMKVVAEGTASKEIWDALCALGCDEAQGYFISPPFPADDLPAWINASQYCLPGRGNALLH